MPKHLVIVESPAKCKTISKYLGDDYVIKASFGHVRDLPQKKLGVDIKDNFLPTYEPLKDKAKILKELKTLAKTADIIYLATDPDREGEAISWHVKEAMALKKTAKVERIVFNEITEKAVKHAIENGRKINDNLVDAQQARRILDRLIGYKLSPILSKKIRRGLSAGRVQSVAVRLICDREKAILAFVSEEYWTIEAELQTQKNNKFIAKLSEIKGEKKLLITNKTDADAILSELKSAQYQIDTIQSKRNFRFPYPPFITSTLQQEASRKLNWSAKKTMMVAQQLYEGVDIGGESTGLITYMRTDSTRLSDEATENAKDYISKTYGKEYLPEKVRIAKAKKGMQDAHEAIRPSYVDKAPDTLEGVLTSDQYKLYKLIWNRLVSSQMKACELETTSVAVAGTMPNKTYILKTSGNVIIFDGFTKIYNESKDHEDDADDDTKLPKLTEKEALDLKNIEGKQKFTQPPHRYTEATLVKEMEEKGIGRPSTYAPTISTIQDRGYVDKEKRTLFPTELGTIVNDQLVKFFDPIIDVDFTAVMETKLDQISEGEHSWQEVVSEYYTPFEALLKIADTDMEKIKQDKPSDEICPTCEKPMVIKAGRFGDFLACSDFPACKTTKSIVVKSGTACPDCGSDIVEKRTRKGKIFYGCGNYPTCKFAAWDKPITKTCTACQSPIMTIKTKKGQTSPTYVCPKCQHEEEVAEA